MIRRVIALMAMRPWCNGSELCVGDWVRHTVVNRSGVYSKVIQVDRFDDEFVHFDDHTHAKKTHTMDWLKRVDAPKGTS